MVKEKILSSIKKFKPTKRGIAVILTVLVTGTFLTGAMFPGGGGPGGGRGQSAAQSETVRTVTLERGDLSSTVSATGTVYSIKSTEVYSTLNYPVKTINVSVGDRVYEGDVLAELKTSSLELDISQKQASVYSSQQSAQQSLATAQQDLQVYQKNLDNNYNTTVTNAESSVNSSKASLKSAELDLQNAELDLESANNDLYSATRKLRDAQRGEGDYEYEEATDSQLASLRDAVRSKETAVDKAQTNLEKAKQKIADAERSVEEAGESLDAAKESASDSIASYQSKVKSAQINTNFNDQYIAIEKLQTDLADCVIKAPVSGTITAVNAVEGGSGSGLLFVIQDTDNLKVVTNIKEYDIDAVGIGDNVVIKSDATGSKEFSGTLTKIAPTSTLTANGSAAASTDAVFESEVTVSEENKGLRIGMNTRLSIITDEKKNVFSVPYEAVETTPDGSCFIYVMTTGGDGKAEYEKIAVTTGLETNLYVEISGEGLQEGIQVVRSASSVAGSGQIQSPDNKQNQNGGAPNAETNPQPVQDENASGPVASSEAGTTAEAKDDSGKED